MKDIIPERIPLVLKSRPCFCNWCAGRKAKNGKPPKIAYVGKDEKGKIIPIDHAKPDTLLTFDAALENVTPGKVGIGIVLSALPDVVVIDGDNVISEDGTIDALGLEILERFPGQYLELSASGKGFHIIGVNNSAQKCNTTIYKSGSEEGVPSVDLFTGGVGRFVAITGQPVPGVNVC